MVHQNPKMPRPGNIDFELGAVPADDRPVRHRIKIIDMAAHIGHRRAAKQTNIDSTFVISINQHRVRIGCLLQDCIVETPQDWTVFDLYEAEHVGLYFSDNPTRVLNRWRLDQIPAPLN